MGRQLAESLPAARRLYDRANKSWATTGQAVLRGPAEELDSTVYSQPALFVTSLAALERCAAKLPEIVAQLRGRRPA